MAQDDLRFPGPSLHGSAIVARTDYSYDSLKRLQTETRQFQGLGGGYSVSYGYNYADALTQVSYSGPGWSRDVYYGYNFTGVPSQVGTTMAPGIPFSTNVMRNFSYRAFGGLKAADYGNNRRIEIGYNSRQTMASMKVYTGADIIINNGYDYFFASGTNNGRVQKITDNVDPNYTTTYEYDDFNRLDKAYSNSIHRDYTYDAWGNITYVFVSGQTEAPGYALGYATNASGAPATNRVNTITFTLPGGGTTPAYAQIYDAAGNQTGDGNTGPTSNFSYDAANRLLSANYGNSSYEYDGDGRRAKSVSGGITTFYLWSSVLGQAVADLTASGSLYRAYVHNSSGQQLALQATDGQFYWTHTDHLGSGRKLTNVSGTVVYRAEFDPRGQMLYQWAQGGASQYNLNSHKFTGYERDASNIDNAGARSYNHNQGRFMQADPLGLGAADLTKPQSLNLYSYVGNDPVNFVDPSGMNLMDPDYWEKSQILFSGGGRGFMSPGIHTYDSMQYNWVMERWDFIPTFIAFQSPGGTSSGGQSVSGGGGGQPRQNQNTPCGEPPWDQAIGPNGIRNQPLNPIEVGTTWTGDDHRYKITKPGSFTDFEDRLKANGWEKFSTDPHYKHWGDNDYRKQYNGEWYHLSMGRPGKDFNPDIAGPTRFSLHWEEAKPGSGIHFLNFVGSTLFGIPIKAFHPCTRKVLAR